LDPLNETAWGDSILVGARDPKILIFNGLAAENGSRIDLDNVRWPSL